MEIENIIVHRALKHLSDQTGIDRKDLRDMILRRPESRTANHFLQLVATMTAQATRETPPPLGR